MVHYSDYLQLEKLLSSQAAESEKHGMPAHDEMLFIIIHQAYELWFSQILHEITSVKKIMQSPAINDNSPELQTVVHRLSRVVTILKVLVHQVDIMETMTPMDFLDFRDMLRPASGFQSWQFKIIEANLGLKFNQRHGQEYYLSQLRPEQVSLIKNAEAERSLLELVNSWLERMPFSDEDRKWEEYSDAYLKSLSDAEKDNVGYFAEVFGDEPGHERHLTPEACRAALFIMLYRGYPILQLPFQLLNNLLEIDEQLSTWRYRHMNMVHRMIGTRVGTGGSSGKEYLKGTADKHYIFAEIARLTSFLIERRKLPPLSREMERKLGFMQVSQ
jgi:tryptophan 2,3-dioxygenase